MKAKKSLGQNFLKSHLALKKIIEAGDLTKEDLVLEIGPGKGALTAQLLATKCQVIAIEKDRDLYDLLKIKFEKEIASGQLKLINGDVLEFDISEEILTFLNGLAGGGTRRTEDLKKSSKLRNYKIIANIPYNITGAILKKFLTCEKQPERMVLMVQKEVAKRIVANKGEGESILSISVKAYGAPSMIMKVPARYFSPAPKVDSAIITINNISRKNFFIPPSQEGGRMEVQNKILNSQAFEEKFWEIVKTGFAHKRKKLSSNLKSLYQGETLINLNLGNKRAEDLSLDDWINIAKS